ncbi:hypothetical protein BU23DRAFT_561836 [Bimuria novae-zelandiae CBS 107.79]|uniref:Uncharacterized protein n=1 Tax=Bimuria novae-zelandiae CBS 107.79 TaxID=1447943 RepID=A0A6A5UTW1_9PLEO|nr:hypothetical protein BU23DRAFT_561836 [Bimuria novae-zelandiae CBS 107.79]
MPPQRTSGRPNDSRNLTEAQKGAIKVFKKVEKACAEALLDLLLNNLLTKVYATCISPPRAKSKNRPATSSKRSGL